MSARTFFTSRLNMLPSLTETTDGIQVDVCTVTRTSPSWLLQAFKVVCCQISEAGA